MAAQPVAPDADRRKDIFIATLAHELQQPVNIILTALRVLRERADRADHRPLDVIDRQSRLPRRLVEDLLDVTRVAEGKLVLQRERLDTRSVVSDVSAGMAPVFQMRQQRFSVAVPSHPVWVDADRARLEQVLTNLLSNSAKYTSDGGRITLVLEQSERTARIRVVDDGRGIAPAALPHVFELFMQEPVAHPRGLGIGLSVVRALVELHGGSVAAYSAGTGRGSEFVVSLPAASDAAADRSFA
jgi:signal transduction histidine kinase